VEAFDKLVFPRTLPVSYPHDSFLLLNLSPTSLGMFQGNSDRASTLPLEPTNKRAYKINLP
jgi:hypothetical protein